MDRLSYEAKRATDAGMSYGRWKALHPVSDYVEPPKKEKRVHVKEPPTKVCPNCGKEFKAIPKTRVYCCDPCYRSYGVRRYAAKHPRK